MFFVWIIYGPTATGKSARAMSLAREKGANILSYDARQVYRGTAILTGQDIPDQYYQDAEGSWVHTDPLQPRLYGLNLINPNEPFSIRHFHTLAKPIVDHHRQQNKPLVIVGGSWPYAQVLIDPPFSLQAQPDATLRHQLQSLDLAQLQKKLQSVDLHRYQAMNESDKNNPRRLIRAIEIASQTLPNVPVKPIIQPTEYSLILHTLPLEKIEANIRQRIKDRLEAGVLEETAHLLEAYSPELPAFSSTGFHYLRQHLLKRISLEEVEQLWYAQERQYAKRQITWLKKIESEKRYNTN